VQKPPPILGYRVGGPSTVLRCSGFAYAAPAAQDDSSGATGLGVLRPFGRPTLLRLRLRSSGGSG